VIDYIGAAIETASRHQNVYLARFMHEELHRWSSEGRGRGDCVDGSVKRSVLWAMWITCVSEAGSFELFGRGASPTCLLRKMEKMFWREKAARLSRRSSKGQCYLPESG
jgi:hypothetical protein